MNTYSCKDGQTWDYVSYLVFKDSFMLDEMLKANSYEYSDTITFGDGDIINIPDNVIKESAIINNPWS